ncbi:PREDICTED: uncharacterized protein LOC108753922 isoform X2 [Trachymyrmex septentrionalis]|uniref:uncharacterized protein LOC108753922 isoform X2 n=1 Tax=Trachymyrmex septentrionalis TaxID=34720 RepID=UPI00084F2D81|nr:PREDICTED: uncharacterized protein LOC108753922 isoform X2 [Trachymyrmex septentrionalis]
MNGFRIWALHNLSYILPTKSLQYETHAPTNKFKRCLSIFLNSSRMQENDCESRRINLTTVSNNLKPIFTTWMDLSEITMTSFSSRSPIYFLSSPLKVNTEITRPKSLKPLIKYEELLDGNPVSRNEYYKRLSNIQANDFDFMYNDNTVIESGNVHCDDCRSEIMFTFQEPKINHTIEQESTDDLLICTTGKNFDSLSSAKLELETLEIKQQESRDQFKLQDNQCSRKYDLSQSPEVRNYTQKDLSSTTKQQIQFSHTSRCVLQTPTISYLFENLRTSSRFGNLTYSRSLGNQEFRKTSLCLPSVPCRAFSSKSWTVIQQSIREFENVKKDQSANTSIIRLRNTRSHPDRLSLMRLQSFSCTSKSKKSADPSDTSNRCQNESKKSQDDVDEKQQKRKPKYMCSELNERNPCTGKQKNRCTKNRRNKNKARVSSKDRAQQSRDSTCSNSQKQDLDRWRQSKLNTQRYDCEKPDEPPKTCQDSLKKTDDFESNCNKRVKCDISENEKCNENDRKRSNSNRKSKSSRTSDKNYSKVNGKRYYSTNDITKQSIFSVPRNRKSFSNSISDIILDKNVRKRFYASCSNNKKDQRPPSYGKPKMNNKKEENCETKKKCAKSTVKCMSRKKATDKTQNCQSMIKDIGKFCESSKSPHKEFCDDRKKELKSDEKLQKEPAKAPPSVKEKSMKELMKEQIDREFKEINECKKNLTKDKKCDKVKMISSEKPTSLDRIINSYKKQEKQNIEKIISTRNESIISMDAVFKWFNIQSRIINGTIPIIAKDVGLFNIMFDRSFSTAKLDYQDDFAIGRTINDDKIDQNYSANGDDFVHGDELPNYVEIEYEDYEEDDEDH